MFRNMNMKFENEKKVQMEDENMNLRRRLSTKLSFQQPSLLTATPVKSKKATIIPNR